MGTITIKTAMKDLTLNRNIQSDRQNQTSIRSQMILRIARSRPVIKTRLQDTDQLESENENSKASVYISQTAIIERLHSWANSIRSISPSSKIKPQHTRFLGANRAVELGFLGAPSALVPKSSKSNI